MSSRIVALLGSAVMAVLFAGCGGDGGGGGGGDDSALSDCLQACNNAANANCERFDKAACDKECKEPKSNFGQDERKVREKCKSELNAYMRCIASAKVTCENGKPTIGDACKSQEDEFTDCGIKVIIKDYL